MNVAKIFLVLKIRGQAALCPRTHTRETDTEMLTDATGQWEEHLVDT